MDLGINFDSIGTISTIVMLGLVTAFAISFRADNWIAKREVSLSRQWLPTLLGRRPKKVPWRMKAALPLRASTVMRGMALCLLNPFGLGIVLEGPWRLLLFPYVAIAVGGIMVGFQFLQSPTFFALRATLARMAAARIVRKLPQEKAEEVVRKLMDAEEGTLESIAKKYLGLLPAATMSERLIALRSSPNYKVAAAIKHHLEDNGALDPPAPIASSAVLTSAIQAYRLAVRQLPSESMIQGLDATKQVEAAEDEIDFLLLPQVPLKAAMPHVFCAKCFARCHEFNSDGWSWLRCKQCAEFDGLLPDVQVVIGQIGGEIAGAQMGVRFVCNVWDQSRKAVIRAEIDALQIIGGQDMDYDWAISSVVTMLIDSGFVTHKKLQIRILNGPPLESNSIALLRKVGQILN